MSLKLNLTKLVGHWQLMQGRPGGEFFFSVFDNQLPAALKKLTFDKHLSAQNVQKIVSEADGYQPHLIAPEQGYRCLVESSLILFHGPAEAVVDATHFILRDMSVNQSASALS